MTDTKKGTVKPFDLGFTFPQTEKVRLDTPNIRGNRTPKEGDIEKYVRLAGGFDARMFRKPYVAKVTAEQGREWINSLPKNKDRSLYETGFLDADGNEDGYFRLLFDGKHRKELYTKLLLERGESLDGATWDCDDYIIDNVKIAHDQFVKIQSELQKNLHKDLLFIQKVYAGVGKKSAEEKVITYLNKAGVVVAHDDEVVGEEHIDDISKPSISVNGFKTIMSGFKDKNFVYVEDAIDILKDALSGYQATKTRMKLNQYLVYGTAFALQQVNGQVDTESRKELVKDSITHWVSEIIGFESAKAEEQLDSLKVAHADAWGSSKLNLSPYSSGIAVTKIVENYQSLKKVFTEVNLDTALMIAQQLKDEKVAKQKKVNNLKKAA